MNNLKEQFTYSHIIYKVFDYSQYPPYLNININAGEYAWKPVCLYDTCKELFCNDNNDNNEKKQVISDKVVMWMDSGNIINSKLDILYNYILKNGIYSNSSAGDIKKWSHPKTIKYMKCDEKLYTKQNKNAACMGYNYNYDWVKDFIKEFYTLALIKDCIAPEGSNRDNHRQDQAIFTILFYGGPLAPHYKKALVPHYRLISLVLDMVG
jgi:hypothetical protein